MSTSAAHIYKEVLGNVYVFASTLICLGINNDTIERGVRRGTNHWQGIKNPDDKRELLIRYDSLKEEYKVVLDTAHGSPEEWKRRSKVKGQENRGAVLARRVIVDAEDLLKAKLHYNNDRKAEMVAEAAGWLRMYMVSKPSDAKAMGFRNKTEMIGVIISEARERGITVLDYKNEGSFKRKVTEFSRKGITALLHKQKGNSNRSTFKMTEQIRAIIGLYGHPSKPSIKRVAREYNKKAEQYGWTKAKETAIRNLVNKPEVEEQWYKGRHGQQAWYAKYSTTITRKNASAPDVMWVMDGTPLDLYYKAVRRTYDEVTEKWKERTNYFNRVDAYVVMDSHSKRIIGWELCKHENADAVRAAMKRAVTQRMVLPKEILSDAGSANKAQKFMLEKMGVLNIPTRPYSPKGKPIESMFGHFQSSVLRYYPNWAGMGINTKTLESRFTPEYVNANKKDFPTLDELQEQFKDAVGRWNAMATRKRECPDVMYAAETGGRAISVLSTVDLFWERRNRTYKYRQDGVTITIGGIERNYRSHDVDVYRRLVHQQVQIVFDVDCPEYVYLYQNDRPILDAQGLPVIAMEAVLVPMAKTDMEEGDRKELNRQMKFKDALAKESDDATEAFANIRENLREEGIAIEYASKNTVNDYETMMKSEMLGGGEEERFLTYDEIMGDEI